MKHDHLAFTSQVHEDTQFTIDYLDILKITKMAIPNADAVDHDDKYIRDNYKFNILLHIELSAVNGISCIRGPKCPEGALTSAENLILERSSVPIVSIYLQLIHEDIADAKVLLTNR